MGPDNSKMLALADINRLPESVSWIAEMQLVIQVGSFSCYGIAIESIIPEQLSILRLPLEQIQERGLAGKKPPQFRNNHWNPNTNHQWRKSRLRHLGRAQRRLIATTLELLPRKWKLIP